MKKHDVRIAIVEHHAMMRMGLAAFLNVMNGVEVVMEVDTAHAAMEALLRTEVNIMMIDLQLPKASGIELVGHAKRLYPDMRVLMIGGTEEAASIAIARKIGADGIIMKSRLIDDMSVAIKNITSGESHWPEIAAPSDEKNPLHSMQPLSPRELEVLRLVGEGKASKEIARLLSVSVRTIDVHRANVKRKLRVKNTSELMKYALVLTAFGSDADRKA